MLEGATPGPPAHPPPAPWAQVADDRLLPGAFEVNERCLELLVHAARRESKGSFRLVGELRELLKTADPGVRRRAACRSFLLVDMEFGNSDWWRGAGSHLSQYARLPHWGRSFPPGSGTQLARAALLVAWNSLRAAGDPETARVLLGIRSIASRRSASASSDRDGRTARPCGGDSCSPPARIAQSSWVNSTSTPCSSSPATSWGPTLDRSDREVWQPFGTRECLFGQVTAAARTSPWD